MCTHIINYNASVDSYAKLKNTSNTRLGYNGVFFGDNAQMNS